MAELKAGSTVGGENVLTTPSTGTAGQYFASSGGYTGSVSAISWTEIASRPTALSQFTNDLGNYGSFAINCATSTTVRDSAERISLVKSGTNLSLTYSACNCVCDCRD